MSITQIYQAEYNYYLAMSPKNYRPAYRDWLKWRNTNAVQQMNTGDLSTVASN